MSPFLSLSIDGGNPHFAPGAELRGTAQWSGAEHANGIEVRLFWFTQGKGTQDVQVVESFILPKREKGEAGFHFKLPHSPYSMSGLLITVTWAIELVIEPGSHAERIEFEMSPTGSELILDSVEKPASGRNWFHPPKP